MILALAVAVLFGSAPLASLLQLGDSYGRIEIRPAPDFELYDSRGARKTLADYRGRFVFLIFGFLRCRDVCHTQVANLVALANQFEGQDIEYLYLSMDGKRDEPATLEAYFDHRGESFTSLHAQSADDMRSIASAYGAGYRIVGDAAGTDYDIEHPARIYLIDTEGRLVRGYGGSNPDVHQIAADFRQLRHPASL